DLLPDISDDLTAKQLNAWFRERRRVSRVLSRRVKTQLRCPFTGRFEKPLPTDVSITDKLQFTALHEAAHAVVALLLGPDILRGVDIIPKGRALGSVFRKKRHVGRTNASLLEAANRSRLMMSLAGPIAEVAF